MKKTFLLIFLLLLNLSVFSQSLSKLSKEAYKYSNSGKIEQSIKSCELILACDKTDKETLEYKVFANYLLFETYRIQDGLQEKTKAFQYGKAALNLLTQIEPLDPGYLKANLTTINEIYYGVAKLLEQNPNINSPAAESSKQNEVANNNIKSKPVESSDAEMITENRVTENQNNNVKENTDKTVTITVSGSGKTQDEAKQSALRSAIEQAFGAFISAKIEILNDQIISDQITSVASGNIQSFDILNASQLPDGSWGVTLKALVSIDKLTSFVEAKGVAVEIKGGLFAQNIKLQILNEQAEIQAVANLVGLLHEPMQTAFDYSIKSGDPKSIDSESKNWRIPLEVTAIANKNMDFCADYFLKTLSALSLSFYEVENYNNLAKKVFFVEISYKNVTKTIYLRTQRSMSVLKTLIRQWDFYTRLFTVQSGLDESNGNGEGNQFKFSEDLSETVRYIIINFLAAGQQAATFSWEDVRTLSQIEKMTGYKVNPRGVVSQFKHGGFVVYEKDGHGLVVAIADLTELDWASSKTACDELVLNGYSDWRLPTEEELNSIYSLYESGVGGFYHYCYWSSIDDSCKQFYNKNGYNRKNTVRAVRTF